MVWSFCGGRFWFNQLKRSSVGELRLSEGASGDRGWERMARHHLTLICDTQAESIAVCLFTGVLARITAAISIKASRTRERSTLTN